MYRKIEKVYTLLNTKEFYSFVCCYSPPMSLVEITRLRTKLFDVYDNKMKIHDWCEMHRSIVLKEIQGKEIEEKEVERKEIEGKDVKGKEFDINESLFPYTECTIYQNIAQHMFTASLIAKKYQINKNKHIEKTLDQKTNPTAKLRREKQGGHGSHDLELQEIIDILCDSPDWNNTLISGIEQRSGISDETVLEALCEEIWESEYKKDIHWLISWCFRFSFVVNKSDVWKKITYTEKLDIHKLVKIISYTHAYKDKFIFDIVFDSLPSKLFHEITSLKILNNTLMRGHIDIVSENPVLRMKTVPFLNKLEKWDILELLSCGIFPIRISIEPSNYLGLLEPWFDLARAQMYIAPSMCYFSPDPISICRADTIKVAKGIRYIWYIYNMFVIKCVNDANHEKLPEIFKDFLFSFVMNSMSPAYNSFIAIMCGQQLCQGEQEKQGEQGIQSLESPMNQNKQYNFSFSGLSPKNQWYPESPRVPTSPRSPKSSKFSWSQGLDKEGNSIGPGNPCPVLKLPDYYKRDSELHRCERNPMSPLNLATSPMNVNVNVRQNPRSPMCRNYQTCSEPGPVPGYGLVKMITSPTNNPYVHNDLFVEKLDDTSIEYNDFMRTIQKNLIRDFSKQFIELSRNNSSCFRFENGTFMKYMPLRFNFYPKDPYVGNNLNDYPFTLDQFTLNKYLVIRGQKVSKLFGMILYLTKDETEIKLFKTNQIHDE